MRPLALLCSVALGAAVAIPPLVAQADPSPAELAAARDLFAEARRAEEAGDWADALAKLRSVAAVKMTPQVRFHIALCEEHLGRLVDALNDYERAKAEAIEGDAATVAEEASEHADAIRERVAKLTIVLPPGTKGAIVRIDGAPISELLLARPVPLDPGPHQVTARAPGLGFEASITLAERQERTLEVVFTQRAEPAAGPAEPAPRGANAGAPVASAEPSEVGQTTLGWALVAGGGVAVGGSIVFALLRGSALSEIESACPSHQNCDPSLRDKQSTAKLDGALAVGLGVLGIGAAGTGVVLLATQTSDTDPRTGLVVAPLVGKTTGGVVGRFAW